MKTDPLLLLSAVQAAIDHTPRTQEEIARRAGLKVGQVRRPLQGLFNMGYLRVTCASGQPDLFRKVPA